MEFSGGCYCGAIRYRAAGEPLRKAMCFCRECQHIAGGGANVVLMMPEAAFAYTAGAPSSFARPDLDAPVRREFCGTCGTHLVARSPRAPGVVLIKVGSLDDPKLGGLPQVAAFMGEAQDFHAVPDGIACFDGAPMRGAR